MLNAVIYYGSKFWIVVNGKIYGNAHYGDEGEDAKSIIKEMTDLATTLGHSPLSFESLDWTVEIQTVMKAEHYCTQSSALQKILNEYNSRSQSN